MLHRTKLEQWKLLQQIATQMDLNLSRIKDFKLALRVYKTLNS